MSFGKAVNVSPVNLRRNDLKKSGVLVGDRALPPDDLFWQHSGKMDCLRFVKRLLLWSYLSHAFYFTVTTLRMTPLESLQLARDNPLPLVLSHC